MAAVFLDRAPEEGAITITAVSPDTLADTLAPLPAEARAWVERAGFKAGPGANLPLPDGKGGCSGILFGLGKPDAAEGGPLVAGALATALPPGAYRLGTGFPDLALAALAFGLGGYRFTRYKTNDKGDVRLVVPDGVDGAELRRAVAAITLARDLVNTPSNDMGPAELADAVRVVAAQHGATVTVTEGEALAEHFPMIAAVGQAAIAARAPRLIDLRWGDEAAPRITLVGKGVAFDTGGLDIKPSDAMLLMKKDMGGAANALALAMMIMGAGLPVRLRLLIPAVENAISGAAFRPGDVLRSRKGLTVEIGNTDAEGRLILGDALTLASDESPELLVDFATLTGAARVALGPDVPAIFTTDDTLAADLLRHAEKAADPLWRLPLWAPYSAMLDSKVADINNAGAGGFAGAITAALFLQRFVGEGLRWLHVDLYAWSRTSRPARPEGGDAQTIRAVYSLLKERFPAP